MACPDPAVLAAAESLVGNPALAEHLEECPSCRLDWQIAHGARDALYGPGEVKSELNDRAMARIASRAQDLRHPPTAREQATSGILVAVATGGVVLLTAATFAPPLLPAVASMLASGVAAVLLLRKQLPRSLHVRSSASATE